MNSQTDDHPNGPKPGLADDDFEQAVREAAALIDDDERPESLFLAMQYPTGTDYVHAYSAVEDDSLDDTATNLLTPLAVHVQQVADAANTDPETVLNCAEVILDACDDGEAFGK